MQVCAKDIKKGMVVTIDIGYGAHSYDAPVWAVEDAEVTPGLFGESRASFRWQYGDERSTAEFTPDQLLEVE